MTDPVVARPATVPSTILDLFRRAERVLVFPHHNPDGDALGSAAGLVHALTAQGRTVGLHLRGSWADHLGFLLKGLPLIDAGAEFPDADLLVLLDCHSFDRLGPGGRAAAAHLAKLPSRPPLVVIDHHLLTEEEAPGEHWLMDSRASSTGELVWSFLRELGWTPPTEGLTALLMAMASDTGFFSQTNTTPEALRAAADLVAAGGSLEEVNRRLRQGQPFRRLKLMGLALDSLELHFGGALATMLITPDMLKRTGAVMADTEDFVELGRSLAGVRLAVLIKDAGQGPNTIRVSLRGVGRVDAQGLARLFGGGGHRQASAYNDPAAGNAAEALANLLARAEKFVQAGGE